MQVLRRKIIHDIDSSVSLVPFSHLEYPLHCHEEYELIFMTSGAGKEYVAHAVEHFRAGDLTLIGNGVPHLHLCDLPDDTKAEKESACDVLYFPVNLFPEALENVEEYRAIRTLLERSRCGIRFSNPVLNKTVHGLMRKIKRAKGIGRVQILLSILDKLSTARNVSLISSDPVVEYEKPFSDATSRIQACLKNRFREPVSLDGIADTIGMNAAAMCRHFKQQTGKTVFQYLSRIRIGHACRLLTETGLSISRIAWESGYTNLSHFNRQFKQITGHTPSGYKRQLSIQPD